VSQHKTLPGVRAGRRSRNYDITRHELQAASLRFDRGIADLTIQGDRHSDRMFTARFEGRQPRVSSNVETVTITSRPFSRRSIGTIQLSERVEWTLDFRGGVSHLKADLSSLRLKALTITGGISRMVLTLPEPHGTVPILIEGGVHRLDITRPPGTSATLQLDGGADRVEFDHQRSGLVSGVARFETSSLHDTDSHFDIVVRGGAASLTVTK
jgi:hypothetical protein